MTPTNTENKLDYDEIKNKKGEDSKPFRFFLNFFQLKVIKDISYNLKLLICVI